jgi:nucleoside-diphosphate-sugar epimerase
MRIKRILVLGSAGQVGAYLVQHLRDQGYEVVGFDIVDSLSEDLRLENNMKLVGELAKTDFVFFLAYDVGGSTYLARYQETFDYISNNSRLMANTFSSLKDSRKPFIFASSQMSNMTHSTYGLLKSIGERYTKSLDGRVIKFWNVYGLETDPDKFHVISDFIRMALDESEIRMRTTGVESRDFLFASDACEALEIVMLKYEELRGEDEIHIAYGKNTTILEIAEKVATLTGSKIVPGSKIDDVQLNRMNTPNSILSTWWKPKVTLDEGLKSLTETMKSND